MLIKLYIDIRNRRFVQSHKSASPFVMPDMIRQDSYLFQIQIVEPNPTGGLGNPLSVVDVTPLSLRVGVGAGTPNSILAAQSTWTKDETNDLFTGALNINTTEMNDALDASSNGQISKLFEVEVIESGDRTTLQTPVTIKNDVLRTGGPDPEPVDPPAWLADAFAAIAADSNSIDVQRAGDIYTWHARRKSSGGISEDSDGLYIDPFTEAVTSENIQAGDAKTITPNAGRRFHFHTYRVQETGGTGNATVTLSEVARTAGDVIIAHFNCDDNTTSEVTITVANSALPFQFTAKVADRNTRFVNAAFLWNGLVWILCGHQFTPFDYSGAPGNSIAKRQVRLDGDTMTGLLQFSGTTHAGLKLLSLTTAQRDALTPSAGMVIYNATASELQGFDGAAWVTLGGGGTGEANTASNVGVGGVGLFKQKSGVALEFRNINAGSSKITVALDAANNEVDVDVAPSAIKLDDLGTPDDNTDLNASTTRHGLLRKLSNVATQRLSGTGQWVAEGAVILVAASDEATPLTAGSAKVTFRMPHAMTLTEVRASLTTAQASGSLLTVDINEGGTSILSTPITIDNTEKTSTTAATSPVISDSNLADDAEMTVDVDVVGDGTATGLKVTLIGTRA